MRMGLDEARHQCRAATVDHERFAGRRRSLAADALDAVALDEDVTRKRFGARAIDDPDIGEERACHGDPPDGVCSASLGISRTARRSMAQSDRPVPAENSIRAGIRGGIG
jgi:hypothetical protein